MTQLFCKIYLLRISASLNIQRKIYTLWGLSRSVTLCSRVNNRRHRYQVGQSPPPRNLSPEQQDLHALQ